MNQSDILIIGAGISGLICATELQKAGRNVRLVDKGRGVGGRMATRRMGGGRIDHGAQFFTVRDDRFRPYVQDWLVKGVVREWYRSAHVDRREEDQIRYCGVTGMSAAAKQLASNLDVVCSERIETLTREKQCWIATSESGNQFEAAELVITAPIPQALQLLDTSGLDYAGDTLAQLQQVQYAKGLALLAILDGPSGLPAPGAVKIKDSAVDWIADNQMKGICPDDVVGITVHATAAYAEEHWNSDDAQRAPRMLEILQSKIQSTVVEHKCHRWGFTHPLTPWLGPDKFFRNRPLGLTLAGDAFGGPRVESAAISGLEAARKLGS